VLLDDGSRLLRAVVDDGVEVRPGLELALPVDGGGQRADHEPGTAVIEVLVQVATETDGLRCLPQALTNNSSTAAQQTMSGELRQAEGAICALLMLLPLLILWLTISSASSEGLSCVQLKAIQLTPSI
jgi:hypothetical protein